MQNARNVIQNTTPKAKKATKERDKRKSLTGHTQSELNQTEKVSPTNVECKEYAGIGPDSIIIYAEQSTCERPSDDVCSLLAEDINYKLRYIIDDCLIKARLLGRNAISSGDIDESFESLNIDKVYGAFASPNWVPFGDLNTDQNLLYLDDSKVNLIQIAEDDIQYSQQSNIIIEKTWIRDEPISEDEEMLITEYFKTVCQSVISNDKDIRQMALEDISENPMTGPITEWFYHFAYFLLTKDITYDCLTLRALHLVEVLENSPVSNENVSEKQLKLLVRLLLQRLLMSTTTREVLRPMCYVLSVLCLREPLKQMAVMKIQQKINVIYKEMALPVLTIIYYLGVETVMEIFIPNMKYFLTKLTQQNESELKEITLSIYNIICKSRENPPFVHESFHEVFGPILVSYWIPKYSITVDKPQNNIDFVNMKKQLIKTRRKISYNLSRCHTSKLEDVFELPSALMDTDVILECKNNNVNIGKISFNMKNNLQAKLNKYKIEYFGRSFRSRQTTLTIGKISLLLKVLTSNETKCLPKCYDHSLLNYNF